ncbi:MAG: hypothetical protein V5A44_06055 [Haloarculaceae archaeon]
MAPVTTRELAAVCRTHDAATVAGFVADLHAARGEAVDDREGATFAVGGDGEATRVAVPVDGAVPADADAVVVAGRTLDGPVDAERIDASDLLNAVLYAVDRDAADALLDRWFDRSLSAFDGGAAAGDGPARTRDATGEGGGDPREGGADDGWVGTVSGGLAGTAPADGRERWPPSGHATDGEPERTRLSGDRSESPGEDDAAGVGDTVDAGATGRRRPLATVAVGVLVLAATGVAAWAGAGYPGVGAATELGAGDGDDSAVLTPYPPGNGAIVPPDYGDGGGGPLPTDAGETRPADQQDAPNRSANLPPGVDASGIDDYQRLVEANRLRLRGQSYRVRLVYRELAGGRAAGVATQTVRVENATTYHASTERVGEFVGTVPKLVETDAYANGSVRHERRARGVARERVTAASPYLDRLSRYLAWYLSMSEWRVVGLDDQGSTATVGLASAGDPWPGNVYATGHVVVTERGVVRSLHRSHVDRYGGDDGTRPARVVITVRVTSVGETAVTPPAWVDNRSG